MFKSITRILHLQHLMEHKLRSSLPPKSPLAISLGFRREIVGFRFSTDDSLWEALRKSVGGGAPARNWGSMGVMRTYSMKPVRTGPCQGINEGCTMMYQVLYRPFFDFV